MYPHRFVMGRSRGLTDQIKLHNQDTEKKIDAFTLFGKGL